MTSDEPLEYKVISTAERMLSMYGNGRSAYTPEQRATDHAFAHDAGSPERKFWLAVLDAMYKINQGETIC